MHCNRICRRTNGTIDIVHYRARALSERAAIRTEFFIGMAKLVRPAVAIALFVATLVTMVTQGPVPEGNATALLSTSVPRQGY